jgi:glycosyltransferase involved in cell wall biosynthesis
MQVVDFNYEILLRDDASTDGTAEICKDYAIKYLDKIKLLGYKENQYKKGVRPFPDNVKRAKGKYIAICEGDDYWIDPYKLQKQVDYMESHPECVLTYHGWRILNQSNNKISSKVNKGPRTLTLLFRNELSDYKLPKQGLNGDMLLKFYLSTKGKFKFLENVKPAIHRHHNGGIWSKKSDYFKLSNKLKTLEEIVHLYENTKHVNKARLNLASIVFSYHISKQELLDKYIKENSIDNLNSYLNINKIKRLFILQKIKNLLRKFLK